MQSNFWDWKAHYDHQPVETVFDCLIAEFLLSQGKSVPSQELAQHLYGVQTLDELAAKQLAKFQQLPTLYAYFTSLELPMIPVLWQMEQTGIFLDVPCLQQVATEMDVAVTELEQSMKKTVGFEINLKSTVQIGTFLAEKLMVPLQKTKTGKYATNETEISQYAEQFPFIQSLLQYRELTKLRSTYVETLIEAVAEDGRIHTRYTQVAAQTGRLSSSAPNLQNIPVSAGFGQKIKSCFKAAKGKVFLSFDYSQQELRILAHLSKEAALIKAFQEKKDVHTATAAQIFSVKYEDVTKEQRMIAKTINFGVVYGMSSFGLSAQLHIPVDAAQQFITSFYTTYPNIRKYFEQYLTEGKMTGFVETILGRRRAVFEQAGHTTIDNSLRRVLINYPIQGSAADLMKKAMITIHQQVVENNPDCALLLQIHDDLVFEVTDNAQVIEDLTVKVKKMMCEVYPLAVPIEVDIKIGKNWGEMTRI